jgi:hypothetical protein
MYFVGNDGTTGNIGVFQYRRLIGTEGQHAIHREIPESSGGRTQLLWRLQHTVANRSAVAIALTNATDTTQRWLMYFPSWNEWFEWDSTVFSPSNGGLYFIGVQGGSGSQANKVYYFASQ